MHLNTEIGLIIDSPELARQVFERFDAMVQPMNSYALALVPGNTAATQSMVWRTQESGESVKNVTEPAQGNWQ